ncbi:MetQ/NlpA family ABC transporter substrate-binding protein [Alkalibacillus almallahensis]|uniref:MetQ/NlpA family ABC transporter substrate-binding protein n=1 Tax=Alkalibacillus almallahensis TaxID=1379154 RepID=UPI001420BEBC|nr:MetQ/NlpA family ABC transporter substrate-binding protein [Alkalibacillus almallahensis]NIK12202.1 D-methionine transport system substrate-binding protein [Alkalibacillus almallahensis]
MKKGILFVTSLLLVAVLAACGTGEAEGGGSGDSDGPVELTVGATPVPHTEVLEEAKPLLEEKGIELTIETFQDYILPNEALADGTLDANYFQHIPYLEDQKEQAGYDFVNLGGIHIEPMGIYSKNIDDISNVEEGTDVIMSRSVADHGRILSLLQEHDLIKIDPEVDPDKAEIDDVVENPKNLNFDASIEAGFLVENYKREEDALVAINTNYAIEGGLNPTEDSLIIEDSDAPYVNVIAARSEDKNSEALQTLVEVLRSDEIQSFMEEEYNGAVVPVSE